MTAVIHEAFLARIAFALIDPRRNPAPGIEPFDVNLSIDRDGNVLFDTPGADFVLAHAGIRLGWIDLPGTGGALISLLGGGGLTTNEAVDEGLLAFMTKAGLNAFIADLQTIADRMEDA